MPYNVQGILIPLDGAQWTVFRTTISPGQRSRSILPKVTEQHVGSTCRYIAKVSLLWLWSNEISVYAAY